MTIGNAIAFIHLGMADAEFRNQLNEAVSPEEMDNILKTRGMAFSDQDFDEAFHNQLTLCAEAENADQLREFKQWWDLLNQLFAPADCSGACGQCTH